MDEITIVNNIFVENRKFTESQEEIKRRKAAVDCFDCCERMLRMPQLVKYASVGSNRGIVVTKACSLSTEAFFHRNRSSQPRPFDGESIDDFH